MIVVMKRTVPILAAAICFALAAAPASAKKGGRDHDDAGEAVSSGRAMPVAAILKSMKGKLGEILEIELDDDDGRLVYEIKYLDSRGRRMEAYVDARTGRILRNGDDD